MLPFSRTNFPAIELSSLVASRLADAIYANLCPWAWARPRPGCWPRAGHNGTAGPRREGAACGSSSCPTTRPTCSPPCRCGGRPPEHRANDRHEDALIRHQASVQAIRVKRDRARAHRHWWTWLRLAFAVGAEKRRAPRPQLLPAGDTGVEEKIKAGIAGEDLVAAELSHALGDDWTLLRGYRNRRGEIDDLLLGPTGLLAIEVKNINATVHVDGDRWQGDKYDNYGNLVEQRLIADRRAARPANSSTSPPTSCSGSCANAASRSPSSAWWSSLTAGPGWPRAAAAPSTSLTSAAGVLSLARRLRGPDRPGPASRAGTAHPPRPRLPPAHPAPGPPPPDRRH